jgi:plastocyanin
MRFGLIAVTVLSGAVSGIAGCSDSTEPTPSGTTDAGGGGTDAGKDTGADAGPEPVNACRSFIDRSAASASRTLTWSFSISSDDARCMQIKVGQSVTFSDGAGKAADFTSHPPIAWGGDKPNPIQSLDKDTGIVNFAAKGTFGFACNNHPAMIGAILVTD